MNERGAPFLIRQCQQTLRGLSSLMCQQTSGVSGLRLPTTKNHHPVVTVRRRRIKDIANAHVAETLVKQMNATLGTHPKTDYIGRRLVSRRNN